eukprot:7377242-Prymnesium_polylepis.2
MKEQREAVGHDDAGRTECGAREPGQAQPTAQLERVPAGELELVRVGGHPARQQQRAWPHAPARAALGVSTLVHAHLDRHARLCGALPAGDVDAEGAADRVPRLGVRRVEPAIRRARAAQQERRRRRRVDAAQRQRSRHRGVHGRSLKKLRHGRHLLVVRPGSRLPFARLPLRPVPSYQ